MGHYEHSDCECDLQQPSLEYSFTETKNTLKRIDTLALDIAAVFLDKSSFRSLIFLYLHQNCQLTEQIILWI